MTKQAEIKGRVWVEVGGVKFIGPGKVQLLELIGEHGSISQAAKAMGMSYRKAWNLIDELNATANEPMVLTQKGGQSGGGAQITSQAKELIAYFKAMQNRFSAFIREEETTFNKFLTKNQ